MEIRGRSFIMSYRLGVGGISQSMTHDDRVGGWGLQSHFVVKPNRCVEVRLGF